MDDLEYIKKEMEKVKISENYSISTPEGRIVNSLVVDMAAYLHDNTRTPAEARRFFNSIVQTAKAELQNKGVL